MAEPFIVESRFRGPPSSGNGGYVLGSLADRVEGAVTGRLSAPVPLDVPLAIESSAEGGRLLGPDGSLLAEVRAGGGGELLEPPIRPTLAAAEAARARFDGLPGFFHPICFTCARALDPDQGLRVFTGALESDPRSVAATWRCHPNFLGPDGLASIATLWAALDCPGSAAWRAQGEEAGLLGSMTAEIRRRPSAEETAIVVAWTLGSERRKRYSGVALLSDEAEVLALARQVWIAFP